MSKTFYNANNLRLKNGFTKNPERYYLEEYFEQLPSVSRAESLDSEGKTVNDIPTDSVLGGKKYISSLTGTGKSISNTTNEDFLQSLEISRRILSQGDVIHVSSIMKVLDAMDTTTIRIRFGTSTSTTRGVPPSVASTQLITDTSAITVNTNDLIIFNFYISIKSYNITHKDFTDATACIYGNIKIGNSIIVINNSTQFGSHLDAILYITNQWDVASSDNQIQCKTFIAYLNSERIVNQNFCVRANNEIDIGTKGAPPPFLESGDFFRLTSYENELRDEINPGLTGGSGIIFTGLDPPFLFVGTMATILYPKKNSPWDNILFRSTSQIEWECAFSLNGSVTGSSFGLGIKAAEGSSGWDYNDHTDQIGFYFNEAFLDTQMMTESERNGGVAIVVTISYVNYISIIKKKFDYNKVFKARISFELNRTARIFLDNVQYNITPITEGLGNNVKPGINKTNQFSDLVNFKPFFRIAQTGNQTNLARMKIYYVKMSCNLTKKYLGTGETSDSQSGY